MNAYDFQHCKLCGRSSGTPTYHLGDSIVYVCAGCDFHYLDHLDGRELIRADRTLSDRDRRYLAKRQNEGLAEHHARIALVSEHLSLNSARCLDIGAGLGQFQSLLETRGGLTEGIEASPLRRQYARETSGRDLSAELVDSPDRQAAQAAFFDLITLWDVIEHVDFPRETLAMAVRLLKPGGLLFLDTPAREAFAYRFSECFYRLSGGRGSLFLPSFYSRAPFGHKQIFTRVQLLTLLCDLGLEPVYRAQRYRGSRRGGPRIIIGARRAC